MIIVDLSKKKVLGMVGLEGGGGKGERDSIYDFSLSALVDKANVLKKNDCSHSTC